MSGIHIASVETDAVSYETFFGDAPIITNVYMVAADTVLIAHSVVAFNASGELVEWAPGGADSTADAVGITAEVIDTTGAAAMHPIYVGGKFNTNAIMWPTGATDEQKKMAFIGTDITHRPFA